MNISINLYAAIVLIALICLFTFVAVLIYKFFKYKTNKKYNYKKKIVKYTKETNILLINSDKVNINQRLLPYNTNNSAAPKGSSKLIGKIIPFKKISKRLRK